MPDFQSSVQFWAGPQSNLPGPMTLKNSLKKMEKKKGRFDDNFNCNRFISLLAFGSRLF